LGGGRPYDPVWGRGEWDATGPVSVGG
jgi:hypothetical protein